MGLKMWGRYKMMEKRKQMKAKREEESQRYQMKPQIGCLIEYLLGLVGRSGRQSRKRRRATKMRCR
jgi:hypothetical protein